MVLRKGVQVETDVRQIAGPATDPSRLSFFDMSRLPLVPVPERPHSIQALVNPVGAEGCSLLAVHYPPNMEVQRHRHDVPQIVLVLEGELRQGKHVLGPGAGYYTPAGMAYKLVAGSEGARLVEFRPTALTFSTEWLTSMSDKHEPTT